MNLETFLSTVYVPLRLRGRSEESVRLLRHAIRQYSKWIGRPATLEDFEDLKVSQYLAARSAKLQPLSVARERSGLVALWNLAQARGLVKLRPCVSPELIPEKTPRALTAEELERLADACRSARGWVGPIEAGVWFSALLGALFYSGERITALLRTPRANWQSPFLSVPAAARKGRKHGRTYELPPEVCELVSQAAAHSGPYVFWWPASSTALRKRWRAIGRRAGLGDSREVQFHCLRRSFASHIAAVAGGARAREALGHSSEAVTRRYLDPRIVKANQSPEWAILPRILPGRN